MPRFTSRTSHLIVFADLHLHTNFSDGTYTPEELTAQGKRAMVFERWR